MVYGEPRLTKDIDQTLGINVDELNRIIGVVDAIKLKIIVDDYKNFVKETLVKLVLFIISLSKTLKKIKRSETD